MSRPIGGRNKKIMGPKPKVKKPGKVLKRLMGIIFKKYKFQLIIVFVCIIISVLSNVQGTLFIQRLIDDYITPLLGVGNPDFLPLAMAILRVAAFYVTGAVATYTYSRIMVYVTQGTMRDIRIYK